MATNWQFNDPVIKFCEKCHRIHAYNEGEYCNVCGNKLTTIKDVVTNDDTPKR